MPGCAGKAACEAVRKICARFIGPEFPRRVHPRHAGGRGPCASGDWVLGVRLAGASDKASAIEREAP
jgi:hypothetical protein